MWLEGRGEEIVTWGVIARRFRIVPVATRLMTFTISHRSDGNVVGGVVYTIPQIRPFFYFLNNSVKN